MLRRHFRLRHNRHSGRHLHHGHTSYAGLAFLLLLTGVLLAGVTLPTAAQRVPKEYQAENPLTEAIGVNATVAGAPPTRGAQIFSPRSGSRVSSTPITVSGACPQNLIVSIFKNDVFAGSTVCSPEGAFTLPVDLFDGENRLVARVEDAIGQRGPDSPTVVVMFASQSFQRGAAGNFGKQLFVQAPFATQGAKVGEKVGWRFGIVGGTPPFAVSWDWGDGRSDLDSIRSEGGIFREHVYERPGNYRVIIRVTDASGNSAFIQVVTIVAGERQAAAVSSTGKGPGILLAWPIYGLAAVLVFAFWLGERRELGVLRKKGRLLES